jgi:hypothetical protein
MKRIRFGSALFLLVLALGFSLVPIQRSSAEEGAGKCNCMHPNTGAYGIKSGTECPVVDCWIEIT